MGLIKNLTRVARVLRGFEMYDLDEFVEKFYINSTEWDRARFYDALFTRRTGMFLHAKQSAEPFIVDTADHFMSREVFTKGSSQFRTVEAAFELIARERGIELTNHTLVDIGANIGVISIPVIARGLCAKAIAVEPTPATCRLLRANIALNGLEESFTVHEVALSNTEGEALFEISEDNTGDNRLTVVAAENAYNEASRQKITVPVKRFDDIFATLDVERCVIWIDVQGFEGFVLAGASKISKTRPPLVLEYWPYGMRRTESLPLLKDALRGYDRFCILFSTMGLPTGEFRPMSDFENFCDSFVPTPGDEIQTLDILVL